MATVKILKRSKKISVRLGYNALFAMRMAVGNYLYVNREDEAMAAFYPFIPAPHTYLKSWHHGKYVPTGQCSVRFDVTHLDCLIHALELTSVGAWPQADSMLLRIRELKKISPLELLGMAAGE